MWAALIKYHAWGGLALLLAVAAVAWAAGTPRSKTTKPKPPP